MVEGMGSREDRRDKDIVLAAVEAFDNRKFNAPSSTSLVARVAESSSAPVSVTSFASILPAWYRPPWDSTLPNRDGVYADPRNPRKAKVLWRKPDEREPQNGVGDRLTNLTPMALQQLLARCTERVRFARLRTEKAMGTVERAIAHASELRTREQALLEPASHLNFDGQSVIDHEELDVLLKLDVLGGAAAESIEVLTHHAALMANGLQRCATCEQVLQLNGATVRVHERHYRGRKTAVNTFDYLEMQRSAHTASALAEEVRRTCQKAIEAVEQQSAKCASASVRISSALAEIASSPHRLALQSRVRLFEMGLDELIYDLDGSGLTNETPMGLLKGRYHFDSPFNLASLSLHREGDSPRLAEGTEQSTEIATGPGAPDKEDVFDPVGDTRCGDVEQEYVDVGAAEEEDMEVVDE